MRKSLLFFLVLWCVSVNAQDRYWVFFSDKDGVHSDASSYLHPKAIERRVAVGVSLDDESDKPVKPAYINAVTARCDSVHIVSRWFNALTCYATDEQLTQIQQLPFVQHVQPVAGYAQLSALKDSVYIADDDTAMFETLLAQTAILGGEAFRAQGITGKGVTVAIFDAGFRDVDEMETFAHIRNRAGIKDGWDFVRKKPLKYKFHSHGAHVMACIGGKYNNIPIGLAEDADFLLARTESNREYRSEEDNWIAAAEWADARGAAIINSSLGYTVQRYFKLDMDGGVSLVSRGANMAARKGMLIVNASGNDASTWWSIIGAPADADSVLTVGGIGPTSGLVTEFSSRGPTADGRLKPNVCAFGHAVFYDGNKLKYIVGTSFATPLVAGFAACVKQHRPDLHGMELFREIEKSASLYPYADYAHGYGIPQGSYFLEGQEAEGDSLFSTKIYYGQSPVVEVTFNDQTYFDTVNKKLFQLQETDGDSTFSAPPQHYFYYHFEDPSGQIGTYRVISMYKEKLSIRLPDDYKQYPILKLHMQGQTQTLRLDETTSN